MAYSLLHEYVPRNAEALLGAGTSITEMQTILHTVHSDSWEVGFQICDAKNKTFGVTGVEMWL
jgi:hypothetical protein